MTLTLKIVYGLLGGTLVVVTGVGLYKLSQKSKNENGKPNQSQQTGTTAAPGTAPSATPGSTQPGTSTGGTSGSESSGSTTGDSAPSQSGQPDQTQTKLGQEAKKILDFIKDKHQNKFVLKVYLTETKKTEDVGKLNDEQLKGLFDAIEKDEKDKTNHFFPQLSGNRGNQETPKEVVVEKTGGK